MLTRAEINYIADGAKKFGESIIDLISYDAQEEIWDINLNDNCAVYFMLNNFPEYLVSVLCGETIILFDDIGEYVEFLNEYYPNRLKIEDESFNLEILEDYFMDNYGTIFSFGDYNGESCWICIF